MTPSPQAHSGRSVAVCGETANPKLLAFSPPIPKPYNLSWMASVPCFSLQGSAGLARLPRNRVLALSNTPQLSVWRRHSNARARLASPSSSKILKVLVARLALQPPLSDLRQMEIRVQRILGPRCSRPGSPVEQPQPQPPQASALLSGQAQAASDRNGWTEGLWESHVCQPSACQLSG